MTTNQIFQEWQENIYDSIDKFEASNTEKNLDILYDIYSFFQIYMDDLVKQKESLISIDKNIIEFVENKLRSVLNLIKELEAYLGVETVQWQFTELSKFQIQIKFLLHFENMELSEKKLLCKLYQALNEKSLTFNPSMGFKYSCYYRAHTLFLYLSQKWNETAIFSPTLSQIVRYSIIQLLNTLDELQKFDEDFVKKDLIFTAYMRIVELISKHNVLLFPGIETLILKIVSKFREVLKQYQHILPIDYWTAIRIDLIIYSLKLGYIEIAQKDAISLYERLNQQKATSNRAYQVSIELLYYCLRKTENSNYNMDELVEKIKLIETDQNFQPLQKLSVDIHQLKKLIEQQKYEQVEPVIDEILKFLSFTENISSLYINIQQYVQSLQNYNQNQKNLRVKYLFQNYLNNNYFLLQVDWLKLNQFNQFKKFSNRSSSAFYYFRHFITIEQLFETNLKVKTIMIIKQLNNFNLRVKSQCFLPLLLSCCYPKCFVARLRKEFRIQCQGKSNVSILRLLDSDPINKAWKKCQQVKLKTEYHNENIVLKYYKIIVQTSVSYFQYKYSLFHNNEYKFRQQIIFIY